MANINVKQADPTEVTVERMQTRAKETFVPYVDIYETDKEVCLLLDMPGVNPDDVDIMFDDGQLTILGRTPERQAETSNYLMREYAVGDFQRTFTVSEAIDPDRIEAEYELGVLRVHLPKVKAAQPRKIRVKGG